MRVQLAPLGEDARRTWRWT